MDTVAKRRKRRRKQDGRGAPVNNANAASHGAYSVVAYGERGRELPAPVLIHLASKIRARVRDLGVESALDLSVAKQDLVRRGRLLDMALSRIEHAYLTGEIHELPERYFVMLNAWQRIEQALGFERVPRDVTPGHREVGALEDLRKRYRAGGAEEEAVPDFEGG